MAVVLARRPPDAAAPPGIPPEAYALALVEDTYEAVADLAGVEAIVAVPPESAWRTQVQGLLWPTTRVVELTTPTDVLERLAADRPLEPALVVEAAEPAVAV